MAARGGRGRRGAMITVKSPAEVAKMAAAAEVVIRALRAARALVAPGVTTKSLDDAVRREIEAAGARPAFLGYRGYPAASCVSVNDEVVHGIPSPRTALREGDLVSIDVGVEREGYYADAAFSLGVGEVNETAQKLLVVGRECLARAIAAAVAGKRIGDISSAIQSAAAEAGLEVVREYVGHGIGAAMHEDPQVPNYGPPDRGVTLVPGMALALEPMVVAGDWRTFVAADGWTVKTRDGGLAVHFEHTVVISEDGPMVLTRGWEEFA